ncbi:MAG TPA: alpha/beta fold hydrolase [Rhodoglobus sp.]|nr:alpha/beta fold hydrolase [Rhodoglobus sp.]
MATTRVVFVHGAYGYEEDAQLATSLRQHLGAEFTIEAPRVPDEDPDLTDVIGDEPVVLVGHSAGGFTLVEHIAKGLVRAPVLALCLIASPYPGGDPDWDIEGWDLPDDLSALPERVFLYASPDDEVVPFAHRDLYAAAIPQAVVRTTEGGHQLGDDLRVVADDIRSIMR